MIDIHKKGAINELIAQAWLLDQGYEVYRNVAQWGPADLVCCNKDGKLLKVEVKTLQPNSRRDDWQFSHAYYLRQEQLLAGDICLLFVNGNACGWNRDWFPPYVKD